MPGARSFADTNVLLYLLSADTAKAGKAEEILALRPVISVQVLNEFTSVARRKLKMDWADLVEVLDSVQALCGVEALTVETHIAARSIAQRYQLNFFDALIAASALEANCTQVWSEDMQSGLLIEHRLRVRNPFTT